MIPELELLQHFPEAVTAGLLVSITCAVLGVFVILKRVVFIGITLSEVAVCGIAASFLLHVPPVIGSIALTLGSVGILAYPFEGQRLPRDTILGVLFVLATAGAVLMVSNSGFGLMEVKALLYGDLILSTAADIRLLWWVLLPVLTGCLVFLRPLLNTFLDRDAAVVMGIRSRFWETLYFSGLGLVIAVASKVAGAVLVFCYLIVPSATALLLSRRLPIVLFLAALIGAASTLIGIGVSFRYDLPTNQTICVVACALFALAALWRLLLAIFPGGRGGRPPSR